MIRLQGVNKNYGDRSVLKNIDFEVPHGSLAVLIGPSGCGKSTTLRLINRMIEPDSGQILVNGVDVKTLEPALLRRGIGYVIQQVGLFPHMTVAENIGVVPKLLGWTAQRRAERADELLELIGLEPSRFRSTYPSQLSGGEAQRIGVARALAADPPVLLMDEPFGAVDPLNREVLQREFQVLQKKLKKTVVFVTHDIDEAVRLGDKIAIMDKGSILQYDSPENILSYPADRFVREFVGSDRALKRLGRFIVGQHMRPAPQLRLDSLLDDEALRLLDEKPSAWVTDSLGRLKGWVSKSAVLLNREGAKKERVEDLMEDVRPFEIAVSQESTLRDALSRMLGQGIRNVPVVDKDWMLVGEIDMGTIEAVTEKGDFSW